MACHIIRGERTRSLFTPRDARAEIECAEFILYPCRSPHGGRLTHPRTWVCAHGSCAHTRLHGPSISAQGVRKLAGSRSRRAATRATAAPRCNLGRQPSATRQPSVTTTFGGFGPELLELLRGAAEFKMNKLSAAEYDETTWSARTWLTFAMQRISVAVHKAVAKELSDALGFSGAVDPRWVPRD